MKSAIESEPRAPSLGSRGNLMSAQTGTRPPLRHIRVSRGLFVGLAGVIIRVQGPKHYLVRLDGFAEGVYFVLRREAFEIRPV